MKYSFTLFLLAGFITIAVFGAWGMGNQLEHHGDCLAAAAQRIDCPQAVAPIDSAAFHISAWQNFLLATLGDDPINLIWLAFALLLLFNLRLFLDQVVQIPQLIFYRYRLRASFASSQKQQLIRWLSLHENSPAFS